MLKGENVEVYRRYFKVTTGPLIEAVKETEAINKAAREAYRGILSDICARTDQYYQCDQRLTGICFNGTPDRGIFKKTNFRGWYPKKNCKAGKELAAKIEAVKVRDPKSDLQIVGLPDSPTLFSACRAYIPTILVIPEKSPVIYISVPWYDEDPEEIEQYRKDRKAGIRGDCNFNAILWKPTSDMVEIKKWEVERHIAEWNDGLKIKEKTNAA